MVPRIYRAVFVYMTICFCVIITIRCQDAQSESGQGNIEQADQLRAKVAKSLKKSFMDSITQDIKTADDLANFQLDLLRKRNAQCFFETQGVVDTAEIEFAVVKSYKNINNNRTLDRFINNFNDMCLNSSVLFNFLQINSSTLSENLQNVAEVVLSQMGNKGCDFCAKEGTTHSHPTTSKFKVWLFGILAVSVIVLTSFVGGFLYPLAKKPFYQKILMFLIALAIGTLTGTGFLHLIPAAFGIAEAPPYSINNAYLWKALVIFGGCYFFFLFEQIMRFAMLFRKHRKYKRVIKKLGEAKPHELEELGDKTLERTSNSSRLDIAKEVVAKAVAPVAWIIICSESLHNLIDGLSIGAAFSDSLSKGLSLSLAIVCEEFPHKLGDFAILLAAGMKFRTAILCNFLASAWIYLGLVLGILIGEDPKTSQWIYAIAGGMFIYIAVCDMMPELSEMGEEIEREELEADSDVSLPENFQLKIKIQNLIIQNLGILIGVVLMLLLAIYAKKISL